jgi:predicted nucleotide-binding protein (sugar kinase/HSP70/actin superfamily)
MKITFPGMGNAAIVLRLMFLSAGVDVVMPASNKGAEEHDAFRDAPEDMCLPFKLFMVQLDKAWHEGADTVVIPSSKGPCRLGEFCELLKVLLDRRGCHFKWIVLDTPGNIGINSLLKRFRSLFEDKAEPVRISVLAGKTYRILNQLESLERDIHSNAGYFDDPQEGTRILNECREELLKAGSFQEAEAVMGHFRWQRNQIHEDYSKNPVRLFLTGEIFTQTEPYACMHLEDRLNDMGVCFDKDVTLGWWLRHTAGGSVGDALGERLKAGRKYLPYNIGGYTRHTVAGASASREMGYDGVIQVMPAGCMPEIVGHAALDRISDEKGINCLTLVFDEMSGEAGYMTRIEAFVDMLERRHDNVLSGS